MNDKVIDVDSGEVIVTSEPVLLRVMAIGSCVAVAAYDSKKELGALAHIMLPGSSPKASTNTKYAADAIGKMISEMTRLGAKKDDIEACLVGGANVLLAEDDTICEAIVESISGLLKKEGIRIAASTVGGTERRSISFDVRSREVSYTEGNGSMRLLHKWNERTMLT